MKRISLKIFIAFIVLFSENVLSHSRSHLQIGVYGPNYAIQIGNYPLPTYGTIYMAPSSPMIIPPQPVIIPRILRLETFCNLIPVFDIYGNIVGYQRMSCWQEWR